MKKALVILLLFSSCSNEPNMNDAVTCVDSYFTALSTADFTKAANYYSSSYGSGSEDRIDKMKKLYDLTGELVSWELIDSTMQKEAGEQASIALTYRVKHKKVTTKEKYIVAPDEGKHLIIGQFIENQ